MKKILFLPLLFILFVSCSSSGSFKKPKIDAFACPYEDELEKVKEENIINVLNSYDTEVLIFSKENKTLYMSSQSPMSPQKGEDFEFDIIPVEDILRTDYFRIFRIELIEESKIKIKKFFWDKEDQLNYIESILDINSKSLTLVKNTYFEQTSNDEFKGLTFDCIELKLQNLPWLKIKY